MLLLLFLLKFMCAFLSVTVRLGGPTRRNSQVVWPLKGCTLSQVAFIDRMHSV